MHKRKHVVSISRAFLPALLFFLLCVSFFFPALASTDVYGYDYVDNNTSNVDDVADIGTHSGFTAQQYGPDSIYDTLTEGDSTTGNITYENSTESYSGTGQSSHNFNYALQKGLGNERLVVVTVSWEDAQASASISSLTFDGTAMTHIVNVTVSTGYSEYISLWYLLDSSLPSSSGSYNVAVTVSEGITREIYMAVTEYSGVKQSAPDDFDTDANTSSGNTAITLNAAANGSLVVAGVGEGGENALTNTNNINNLQEQVLTSSGSALGHHTNVNSGNVIVGWNNLATREGMAGAVWQPGNTNYELDLEVQWANASYTQLNEELCIKTGTTGAEEIKVDVWNGSEWINVFTDLTPNSWNNISVSAYLASSNFTIRFRGGTETGDTSQDSWEIDCTLLHTWGAPPTANFSYTPEQPYTGESIIFNASTSNDPDGVIISYFWDFGDGTNGTDEVITHIYNDNGTYTVTLTVTDNDGLSDTCLSNVTVLNRPPAASFTESAETVYTGDAITFNASDSYDPDGTIVSYFWDFGDGTNATGVIVEHAYFNSGNYTVTLTVTDDDGDTASTSATKTVLNRAPVASFTESAETVYTSESITFNASDSYDPDGTIVDYFWDFGDGSNATGEVVEHTYVDDGNYTVTLTVTDDKGATDSTSSTKTVLNRHPVPWFTESAETVYTSEPITFNASESYDPDGAIVSYFWDFGDGGNATGEIVEHTYADDGNYTVTLTVTDDDGATASTTATKTVLNRPPVASFTESAETVYTDETITFNASDSYDSDGTIVGYFWDFGDGCNATGIVVKHAYADDGNYTVTLTVTDDDGTTSTSAATKTVLNRPPVAIFTESAETVYTGETITFNASDSYDPDGTIASYFWDFGDGTNGTGAIVEHTYADKDNYTVTLTVTDNDGATDTASATKTVLNRPPVASFTESLETAYVGETIYFNATDSYDPDGTIVSYFWDFGDGTNATAVTVEHAYATNRTFTVTLTVTDDDGATDSVSSTKTILINEPPVALFTESAETVYTGDAITFNANDSYDPDGIIVSYEWDFGDGTNATGVVVEHAYANDGTYTVTLTVTDDKGATDTTTSTKTVLNRPPVASFTESATTVLTGGVIYFNASASYDPDGSIVIYFWDFGDGTNGTGVVVDHSYADDGDYTVTLTVTDDDGATGAATAVKTVLNRPPVASFTESAETVFTGEPITFNASASYDSDGSIVSYFWDFGDGINATGVVVGHAYSDDGNYTVTLTVTDDDGATDTASATKTVLNRPPVASFTESAETVYTGETITFNASASYDSDGVIVSYYWDFGDGTNATDVVVSHAYSTNGTFTVTLTVEDDDAAVNSAQTTKTVLESIIIHNVAVIEVTPSATEVYKRQVLNVTVVVKNEGTGTENFNVTLYHAAVHGWHLVEVDEYFVWFCHGESSGDFLLMTSITIPADNPVLTFDTKYDLEFLWDFGFVQISRDEGTTWQSLENAYTTYNHDPGTDPNIIANLPGFTGNSQDWPAWITMTFNLTDYAGETVMLGFRYMTDTAHLEEGWYIDNVSVNSNIVPNQAFEQSNPPPVNTIQTQIVTNLAPGSQAILTFSWNTTTTPKGTYSIGATASTIIGETETSNNTYLNGAVKVKACPDLDGDGDVDIYDVVIVTSIYGCKEGDACWNPKADLSENGVIDIYDVVGVTSHYGETNIYEA